MIKQEQTRRNCTLLNAVHVFDDIHEQWFSPQYWASQDAIIGHSMGRNKAYFFSSQSREYVLRHYYRGGMIGKVIHDAYLYLGINRTRCAQELLLLDELYRIGLPVPAPISARIIRKGLAYSADLITQKIPNAQDIFHCLQERELDPAQWYEVGRCIKRFHLANVFHADLNIHNILIDKDMKIWLIDFDRCGIREGNTWKQDNLKRLFRSLKKEKLKHTIFHWQPNDWHSLLKGYNEAPAHHTPNEC